MTGNLRRKRIKPARPAIGLYYTFGPFGAYDLPDDEAYFYQYDQDTEGKNLTFDMSLGGEFGLMGRQHQFFAALEYYDDMDPFENLLFNSLALETSICWAVAVDCWPTALRFRWWIAPRLLQDEKPNRAPRTFEPACSCC